ncbi:MAG: family 10 glycosylhydrolase [Candidatus Latescibacteria bacterium]|nr:family 10 glycosylhydrolase [Candidatus Latescibacterota bacterium]
MPHSPFHRRLFILSLLNLLAPPTLQAQEARLALCGTSFMEPLGAALQNAGLAYQEITAEALLSQGKRNFDAVFLAYDAADSTTLPQIEAFVRQGGRLFTFYTLPPRLQKLLGIVQDEYTPQAYDGQFAFIHSTDAIPHLPAKLVQNSWNIYRCSPVDTQVKIAATWFARDQRDTGLPALLAGPKGAHLTHVLLGHDTAVAGEFYTALLAVYFPSIWDRARRGLSEQINRLGGGPRLLAQRVRANKKSRQTWARLETSRRRIDAHLHADAPTAAWRETHRARQLAVQAYAQSQPARPSEFRGVWIHDPAGVADWGWARTSRHLADHGFNAILVNMLDAGVAAYPSRVLPNDPEHTETGDLLGEAVEAAHKAGLEVHIWKVNYNLNSADSSFVAQMRAEGRLQQTAEGREIPWLCPSHPDNIALELASLLEVVRTSGADGIHLDYIRYPHAQGCYDQGCRQRFEQQTGHQVPSWPADVLRGHLTPVFQQWRQQQITQLVQAVSLRARALRADIRLSAAVFADWPRTRFSLGQDWVGWARQGLLDFVCPMDYIPDQDRFERTVRDQVDWLGGRIPLYIGIGVYRLPGPGALLDQIAWTRRAGADGFALFQYDLPLAIQTLPLLHQGVSRQPTRPPHQGPTLWSAVNAPGTPDSTGLLFQAGQPLPLQIQLIAATPIQRAQGQASLRTLSGQPVRKLGPLNSRDQAWMETTLVLPPGNYRPVVEGQYRDSRGDKYPFVQRGSLLRVRPAAYIDSLQQRLDPP